MTRFIKKYVTGCLDCRYKRGQYGKQEGYLFPLHTWHIDHLGPFCKSHKGHSYMLIIIVDAFSKFVVARPTKTVGAQEVVDHLNDLFSTPKRIISDHGKAFQSSIFKAFITRHHVRHVLNAVASLRSNGQVERSNRTILDGLNTSIENVSDWQKALVLDTHLTYLCLALKKIAMPIWAKTNLW
jgi:transposase InsO family protein